MLTCYSSSVALLCRAHSAATCLPTLSAHSNTHTDKTKLTHELELATLKKTQTLELQWNHARVGNTSSKRRTEPQPWDKQMEANTCQIIVTASSTTTQKRKNRSSFQKETSQMDSKSHLRRQKTTIQNPERHYKNRENDLEPARKLCLNRLGTCKVGYIGPPSNLQHAWVHGPILYVI